MCSTQLEFEWTIDEVSSLNPANVEAHETQFVSSEDPETEAKAQAAISSFFKDRIIGMCICCHIFNSIARHRCFDFFHSILFFFSFRLANISS